MIRKAFLFAVLSVAISLSSAVGQSGDSATEGTTATGTFSDFEIIAERNIFNPSRSPSRRESRRDTAPSPVPDAIDLLGTWITDRQAAAFIEGTRPGNTGAPSVGSTVGGWRLAAISTDQVVLEKDGKQLVWPVGQRIERDGDEGWKLAGLASPRETLSSSSSSTSSSSTESASSGGGSTEDVLQRMRERRQREMQQ